MPVGSGGAPTAMSARYPPGVTGLVKNSARARGLEREPEFWKG